MPADPVARKAIDEILGRLDLVEAGLTQTNEALAGLEGRADVYAAALTGLEGRVSDAEVRLDTLEAEEPPPVDAEPPAPVASFTSDVSGTAVHFDGTGSTGDIVAWAWNLGAVDVNGQPVVRTGSVVDHDYSHGGDRTVGLTVTDSLGRTAAMEAVVAVPGSGEEPPPPVDPDPPPDEEPPPPPPEGIVAWEDFSGGVRHSDRGMSWATANNATSVVPDPTGELGGYVLRLRHNAKPDGGDSTNEQRFTLDQPLREATIRYKLWCPPNYEHRSQGGADNNKFFTAWEDAPEIPGDGYGGDPDDCIIVMETRPKNDGTGSSYVYCHYDSAVTGYLENSDRPNQRANWSPPASDIFTPAERGKWHDVEVYRKNGDLGKANGSIELKVGGKVMISRRNFAWESDRPGWEHGYFLGWSNSGFAEETVFLIADVQVFAGAPENWPSG
jgi:hypothetical protein